MKQGFTGAVGGKGAYCLRGRKVGYEVILKGLALVIEHFKNTCCGWSVFLRNTQMGIHCTVQLASVRVDGQLDMFTNSKCG